MSDIKGNARTAMASKLLADAARDEANAARTELAAQMADVITDRLRVKDDTGAEIGAIVLAGGKTTAKITDARAFIAWVAERYPSEVQQTVRPHFADRLLHHATAVGDPVDERGEAIPGVELLRGEPYLSVRPTAAAKRRMAELLAGAGLLEAAGLLELGAGDEAA